MQEDGVTLPMQSFYILYAPLSHMVEHLIVYWPINKIMWLKYNKVLLYVSFEMTSYTELGVRYTSSLTRDLEW